MVDQPEEVDIEVIEEEVTVLIKEINQDKNNNHNNNSKKNNDLKFYCSSHK
jgi:hypothetical protein